VRVAAIDAAASQTVMQQWDGHGNTIKSSIGKAAPWCTRILADRFTPARWSSFLKILESFMSPVLVFFHCSSSAGYAITRMERALFDVVRQFVDRDDQIHFAYVELEEGKPRSHPPEVQHVFQMDTRSSDAAAHEKLRSYIKTHGIKLAIGVDQPVSAPGFKALRDGGVETFITYWGAPMSSINHGVKLFLKRLQVKLSTLGPDHYIFESRGMQRTAVEGRGIPAERTSVAYLGVDTETYHPTDPPDWYAHDAFGISHDRHIVYYSGHMEERKGVHVLVRAAVELVGRGVRNVHFLFLGNQHGEESKFDSIYRGTPAEQHITFGGYRRDVPRIIPGCYVATIGSTGWDSFPLSAMEMQSCGMPLFVSRLPGLEETVEEGVTGRTFTTGDHVALADLLANLLSNPEERDRMSRAARERILRDFTVDRQISSLHAIVDRVYNRKR
jgi:glycosyltransferase involved in cell wall biosynthesis